MLLLIVNLPSLAEFQLLSFVSQAGRIVCGNDILRAVNYSLLGRLCGKPQLLPLAVQFNHFE